MSGWTWRPAQRDVASRAEGTWRPAQRGRGVPCRGHVMSLAEGMWRPAQRGRGVQRERGVPRRRVQGGWVTRPRRDLWVLSLWACGCVGARARARACVRKIAVRRICGEQIAREHTHVSPVRRAVPPASQLKATAPTRGQQSDICFKPRVLDRAPSHFRAVPASKRPVRPQHGRFPSRPTQGGVRPASAYLQHAQTRLRARQARPGPAGGTAGPCGQAGPRAVRGQRRPEGRVASTPVAGAAAATKHGPQLPEPAH